MADDNPTGSPADQAGAGPDATDDSPATKAGETAPEPDRRTRAVAGATRRPPPRRTGVFVDPDDLRSHVGSLLQSILGGYEVDGFGNFSFTHEDARVFVTVGATPVGLAVNIHSVTNLDLDLDADLARFLAVTNHGLGFGALSYDTDNRAVWLRHSLLGTTLDAPELRAAVASVARTAAALDGEIISRFGGRTFGEASPEVQAATGPPATTVSATGPDSTPSTDQATDGAPETGAPNVTGYL